MPALPRPSRAHIILLIAGLIASVTIALVPIALPPITSGAASAQQRAPIPPQCREEIRNLCSANAPAQRGEMRGEMRACLRERFAQLSPSCQDAVRGAVQQGRAARANDAPAPNAYIAPARVSRTVVFGPHQRQQVDIYEPGDAVDPRPLILYIHGGAWRAGSHKRVLAKPAHFTGQGYIFASTGYRLLPDFPIETQATDIGAAIRALRGQASAIGFDPDRIVLIGHSAGAHLAALVATDPSYAGDGFGAIRAVIALDGAGFDAPTRIESAPPEDWQIFINAFGYDRARQTALSPVTHIGAPDAPNWLALYVPQRDIARTQAETLVTGLQQAGANAAAIGIENTDHGAINRDLGTANGTAQAQAIDDFLARVLN